MCSAYDACVLFPDGNLVVGLNPGSERIYVCTAGNAWRAHLSALSIVPVVVTLEISVPSAPQLLFCVLFLFYLTLSDSLFPRAWLASATLVVTLRLSYASQVLLLF